MTPQAKESPKVIVVFAEGTADIRKAGTSDAADRAYLDAQRKAIEQALGRMYSARTVVDSGRFIEQNVFSNIQGYIRKWEKISGPEVQPYPGTEQEIIWVKIRAEVGKDKLSEDTFALQEMQRKLGRPDIAIIMDNVHAKQVIENKLREKKFRVKNLGKPADPRQEAIENNVDIIIVGTVEAHNAGAVMEGVRMQSFQADVIFKAINTADGITLAESSAHNAFPHIEEESGKAGAVRKASENAADELIDKMITGWENVLNNGNMFYLNAKGLSMNDESNFKKKLTNNLRGIKEVHSRGLKDDVFMFKLMFLGNVKTLAGELSENMNVKVTGYRVNTVEVRLD